VRAAAAGNECDEPLVVAGMRQLGEKPRREIWRRMADRLRESVELTLGNGGYSCADG